MQLAARGFQGGQVLLVGPLELSNRSDKGSALCVRNKPHQRLVLGGIEQAMAVDLVVCGKGAEGREKAEERVRSSIWRGMRRRGKERAKEGVAEGVELAVEEPLCYAPRPPRGNVVASGHS